MRTTLIVFPPPCLDQLPRLLEVDEPVSVQAFGPERSVEAFYEGSPNCILVSLHKLIGTANLFPLTPSPLLNLSLPFKLIP